MKGLRGSLAMGLAVLGRPRDEHEPGTECQLQRRDDVPESHLHLGIDGVSANRRAVRRADGEPFRTDKATIVYQNGLGSCDGPAGIMSGSMLTRHRERLDAGPNFATDKTSVTKASCTLDGTHAADVGPTDIFWKNCPNLSGVAQPADIKDFQGPAQAMIFVVSAPQNSGFTAMSALEAQLLWGCGMGGMVTPFDDNNGIQQRNPNSGLAGPRRQGDQRPAHRVLRKDEQRRRRRRCLDHALRDDVTARTRPSASSPAICSTRTGRRSTRSRSRRSTRTRPTTPTRAGTPRTARTCATGTTASGAPSTSS